MEQMMEARGWLPLVLCGFIALLSLRCLFESWLHYRKSKPTWRRHAIIGLVLGALSPLVYSPVFAAMPALLAIALVCLGLETRKNRLRPIVDGLAVVGLVAGLGMLAFGYTLSVGYGPSMWPATPRGFSLALLEPRAYANAAPARGDTVQMWVSNAFNHPGLDPEREWPAGRYHKRIFGLPGDRIVIDERGLSVNGVRAADCSTPGAPLPYSRWMCHVSLPSKHGPVEYDVSWGEGDWFWGKTDMIVPDGKVFLLGDNLTESADSRDRGVVPIEWVVGRYH